MYKKTSTTLDFWAFRSKTDPADLKNMVGAIYHQQSGLKIDFIDSGSGWQGYEKKLIINAGGATLGILAFGGEHQLGWSYVGLTGKGCDWLGDVDQAHAFVSKTEKYQLRRVDIALTLKDGSVGHEQVMAAYENGGFKLSGRPPKIKQILPGDPIDGRTIYIGNRQRDKFFRAYEKGFEMMKNIPKEFRSMATCFDGVPARDIYRLELELKPKTCPLPEDIIENRDQYFAGAYPYLQSVLDVEPQVMQIRRETGPMLDLEMALDLIRHQYGNTLYTALIAYKGDVSKLMSKILGSRHNAAMLEAGVLLVDHDD